MANASISQIKVGNITYDIHDAKALPSNADANYVLRIKNQDNSEDIFTVDWGGNIECTGMLKAVYTEDTCTVNTSNASIAGNANYCWHNGAVCTITITVNLKSSLATNNAVTVATAPSGYRPAHDVVGQVYITGQNPAELQVRLTEDGAIILNNRSGSAVNTSANIYISFTFAL